MIDWQVAARTAERVGGAGPRLDSSRAEDVVAELHDAARSVTRPVSEYTGLEAPDAGAPVLVLDRSRWIEANFASFERILTPLFERISAQSGRPGRAARAISERVNGVELGFVMGFMSDKVLGQFDPFWDDGHAAGRLYLVAPNIVHIGEQLGVDPHDFRTWVCLHEETHRLQFTAVPWMRQHLNDLVGEFIDATQLDASALSRLLEDGIKELGKIVRADPDASLAGLFQNDRQREIVDKITGVMSLLEGHADVVMDGVGPEVVPTVDDIRAKFERRRRTARGSDKIMRKLLGLDAKMRQYRDGAEFVRTVTERVGRTGFDAVWQDPQNLPTKDEIRDPAQWILRVLD